MFTGTFPALVTPMLGDDGIDPNIDYDSFEQLIEWHLSCKVDGFVVCGTTGESATLSHDERKNLSAFAIERIGGRVPVIIGTGTNSTKVSLEASIQARELGADGVLLVTPYYNKPTQEGLYHHFRTVAEGCGLPVILYDIPGRSVVELSLDTIKRLSIIDNIVAIKDATGDLGKAALVQKDTSDDFFLLSGEDALTSEIIRLGGKGVISASANVLPEKMCEIVRTGLSGDEEASKRLQDALKAHIEALFLEPNPAPAKSVLARQGKITSPAVRLPLVPVSVETHQTLERVFSLA